MKLIKYDPNRYTEKSVKFVNTWIVGSWTKPEIIGCRDKKDGREEDLIFYREPNGDVRIACLPRKHSKGKGWEGEPCFYGDLTHFCKVRYANIYGCCKSIWYRHDSYMKIKRNVERTFA